MQLERLLAMIVKSLKSIKLALFGLLTVLILNLGFLMNTMLIKDRYVCALNDSQSLPENFFVLDKKKDLNTLAVNDVIGFHFKHKDDIYFDYNHNFIKKISCMAGSTLNVKENTYYCDGKKIAVSRSLDSKGRKIEPFIFNGQIAKGEFFVLGTHYKSYDSRYWGFVHKEDIIGIAIW